MRFVTLRPSLPRACVVSPRVTQAVGAPKRLLHVSSFLVDDAAGEKEEKIPRVTGDEPRGDTTLLEAAKMGGKDSAAFVKLVADLHVAEFRVGSLVAEGSFFRESVERAASKNPVLVPVLGLFLDFCVDAVRLDPLKPEEFLRKLKREFGFAENRFTIPVELNELPFFKTTEFRAEQIAGVLGVWREAFEARENFCEALPYVAASPGSGKTRLATVLAARGLPIDGGWANDGEFEAAIERLPGESAEFVQVMRDAVGVAVTFGYETLWVDELDTRDGMLGVRMVFGHFIRGGQAMFRRFLLRMVKEKCAQLSAIDALRRIQHDVAKNFPLSSERRRIVILVVDELLRSRYPEMVVHDISALMTAARTEVMPFLTSLSDSVVAAAASNSGRKLKQICVRALPWASVQRLVWCVKGEQRRKRLLSKPFESALRDCAGVPRLLEVVFKAATHSSFDVPKRLTTSRVYFVVLDMPEVSFYGTDSVAESASDAVMAAFLRDRRCNVDNAFFKKEEELIENGFFHALHVPGAASVVHGAPSPSGANFSSDESPGDAPFPYVPPPLYGVPPLFLLLWDRNSGGTDPLLRAIGEFLWCERDDDCKLPSTFEKQMLSLWKICDIADSLWREKSWPWLKKPLPRSIASILRCDVVDGFIVVEGASYSRPLAGNAQKIYSQSGTADEDADVDFFAGKLGIVKFPKLQEPGIDALVTNELKEATASGKTIHYTGLQIRFSGVEASSYTSVVECFVNTLLYHRELAEALVDNRFCFVLMSFQNVARWSVSKWCKMVHQALKKLLLTKIEGGMETPRLQAIVKNLDVLGKIEQVMLERSLIVLQRPDVERLLTPTLRSRSAFATDAEEVRENDAKGKDMGVNGVSTTRRD